MRYFNYYLSKEGHTYSCDMIRLKYEFKFECATDMLKELNSIQLSFSLGIDVQFFESFKSSGYRYLFVVNGGIRGDVFDVNINSDYKFSIGVRHNMDTDKHSMTGFIEFNPNKCDVDVVSKYMSIIKKYANYLGNGSYFDLVRFDMAIDIKTPRYALKLIKEGKRTYTYMQNKSLTEYLGVRHTEGFVKLYDKREESALDYDLTRLEITCTGLDKVSLPRVLYTDGQFTMDEGLTNTDFVLVSLIRQQEEHQQQYYLSKLGRNKRDKLRPYIIGGSSILEYDRRGILHVQDIVKNAMRVIF